MRTTALNRLRKHGASAESDSNEPGQRETLRPGFPGSALQLPWTPSIFPYSCDNDKDGLFAKPILHAQDHFVFGAIPEIITSMFALLEREVAGKNTMWYQR